ncbi:MAG: superoxide dismutase [Ferruginibacter sp.]
MPTNSRRKFIGTTVKASAATLLAAPALSAFLASCSTSKNTSGSTIKTNFDQQPLPYAYNALEPWIDTQTMDIHYNKHAAAYSKNLKEAATAEGADSKTALEDILNKISKYSPKMRNNGGGHYNHELFWKCLLPNSTAQPSGKLLTAINAQFGSVDEMKKQFNDAAKTRFGSGWAWLIVTSDKKLAITSTANQDNPLMDVADKKGFPIFGLDVWEHAYYLKYQNRRADYIDNFWKILNWNYAGDRYNSL